MKKIIGWLVQKLWRREIIEGRHQITSEIKRRFVELPLDEQWFGSLVGFVCGFAFLASTLKFESQNLIHFVWFLRWVLAYLGVMLLSLMAYKKWLGENWNGQSLFPRVLTFFVHLAWWGVVLAVVIYDVIVLVFFR